MGLKDQNDRVKATLKFTVNTGFYEKIQFNRLDNGTKFTLLKQQNM